MSFFQTRVNRRRAILMLVCLLGLGVGLLLLRPESRPPAPVVLLPLPYKAPVRVPMPDRWIPPSWGWLWRLKESILGKRKVISLDIAGFDREDRSEAFLSALSLRPPDCADTNGIKVWLIGEAEFAGLRQRIEKTLGATIIRRAGIITADGVQSQLSSGNTSSGLVVDMFPRVREHSTDLTAAITFWEAVTNQPSGATGQIPTTPGPARTNFNVAARIQLPRGSGVLLLDGHEPGKTAGVIISANRPASKK